MDDEARIHTTLHATDESAVASGPDEPHRRTGPDEGDDDVEGRKTIPLFDEDLIEYKPEE